MKNKLIKLVLGLVQFLIDFQIITVFFTAFAIIIGGICCLISPQTFLDQPLSWNLVLQGIIAAILAGLVFFGLLAAHRLLDNLNRAQYFVVANCLALKQLLWFSTAGTVVSGITTIWLQLSHIKPFTDWIIMTGNDFGNNLSLIIILLIIYLIFQRGITLQNDADSII